jgi:hypothetical protein
MYATAVPMLMHIKGELQKYLHISVSLNLQFIFVNLFISAMAFNLR